MGAARGWDKLIALGCLHRRSTRLNIRARAFPRPRVCPEYGPVLDASAYFQFWACLVGCALLDCYQSYCEEVRTLMSPARIDIQPFSAKILPDLYAVCAPASHASIRVGLRAKRSLVCRRRMGSDALAPSSPQLSKCLVYLGVVAPVLQSFVPFNIFFIQSLRRAFLWKR